MLGDSVSETALADICVSVWSRLLTGTAIVNTNTHTHRGALLDDSTLIVAEHPIRMLDTLSSVWTLDITISINIGYYINTTLSFSIG